MTSSIETGIGVREPTALFAELNHLFEDLDAFAFAPFGHATVVAPFPSRTGRAPRIAPTDIVDAGPSFEIDLELPGIPKEQLEVRIRGTRLEVRGEALGSTQASEKDWVHRERSFTGFYRAVELPEPVKSAEAKATVKDGVLHLELPKLTPTPTPDEVKVPVQ